VIRSFSSIPVFFRPEMAADAGSYSPSASKPPLVVADWQAHGLPVTVKSFDAVDEATLALAHDTDYVRGILAGHILNGFGNRSRAVAATLTYTSGAMLAAAQAAPSPVAGSLARPCRASTTRAMPVVAGSAPSTD